MSLNRGGQGEQKMVERRRKEDSSGETEKSKVRTALHFFVLSPASGFHNPVWASAAGVTERRCRAVSGV